MAFRNTLALSLSATLACAAAAMSAPALAQDTRVTIMPEDAESLEFQTQFGYADAVVVGDTIYLSGVVANRLPGEDSLEPAFERAFVRIGATLARAGASWSDVVDMTTFHTDLAGQITPFSRVKNRYVAAPFPAWTAIGISSLFEPTAVVEIKIVAHRRR